jgi:hypothetical protein
MGFAYCRFREETGCYRTGSREWHVHLTDSNLILNVPELWSHYMIDHLVQPLKKEREIVMSANPENARTVNILTYYPQRLEQVNILYVEKIPDGYTHEVGNSVDSEFMEKLEVLLSKVEPLQTKGL